MKKSLLILGIAISLLSCNEKESTSSEFKSAYVDTVELLKDYEKFKDEDEKFKVKSEELSRPLKVKVEAFQSEAANFSRNAQIKGQAWAQQKGAQLQQTEQQLGMEQDALMRQIQVDSDSIRNGIIKELKDYVKEYGKREKLDYIYGTGDANTVLYAKDTYNVTAKILKELNEKFSKSAATETKATTETKKEEKK